MKQKVFLRSARGASLIEALVALAVMAFGMLGVVGMQSTLRTNADLSRQRAEAVRLAQEEVERVRNYSVLRASDAASGQLSFEGIVAVASQEIPASAANTTFFRETLVAIPTGDDPLVRHVRVTVAWADRRASDALDLNQRIELSSMVSGFPAEVAALHAMRTDRGPLQQPLGRNAAIPRGAVDLGDGTSRFTPPGGSPDLRWIFNNTTGFITQICNPPGLCTPTNRLLLAGIVAFATGAEPTASEAEVPGDPASAVGIRVDLSTPAVADEVCVTQLASTRVTYFCAVPVTAGERIWSGKVLFSGLSTATSMADSDASLYKVCRYTPDDRNLTAIPTTESAIYYNERHPFTYRRVNSPQVNKNFLIISAGDGTTAYSCPDENTSTLVESNSWPHDPAS